VSFDPMLPAAAAPSVPQAPADATSVDTAALAADVNTTGTAVIAGQADTGGGEAIRTIAAGGDLYVTGTLRAADLGAGRQGLDLKATGTLYVAGTVDASGASGTAQAGGAIRLSGNQIVITGKLLTAGGDGDLSGGSAGAITLTAAQGVAFSGTIEAFGGNGKGAAAVTGGSGGALTVTAGSDVSFAGTVLVRGGAATDTTEGSAQGGAAAAVTIDANGAVDVGAAIDARGGLATAGGAGAVGGGAAGAIRVGENTVPSAIAIRVPVVATGGAGNDIGGAGGTVTAEPGAGNINVSGPRAIDVTGGDSRAAPGAGGLVNGSPRGDPGSGGLHVAGEIVANGGSILDGGSGNGGEGGRVDIELVPVDGVVTVEQSGKIAADGGKANAGIAGGGGHIWLFTKDGDLTIAGAMSVRAGDASDSGGTGGLGGMIYLFSDADHNAVDVGSGNLLITSTGTLDASGGNGAIGGSARSDGIAGFVPRFPDDQEQIAIFLNCDGQHGETRNWMKNDGVLIARGGAHNGSGGDIVYHGIAPDTRDTTVAGGNHHPPSGNVDMSGDGTGAAGDYGAE
jgi:hypothetical protein